jgi:hypothetical protein
MPTALHSQTQLTFWFGGEVLPRKHGFPMKLRIPSARLKSATISTAAVGRPMPKIDSVDSEPAVGACALKRYRALPGSNYGWHFHDEGHKECLVLEGDLIMGD